MSKQFLSAEERILVERLKREARDDWPEHSELLHRRIVAAVKRRQAEISPRRALADARWRGGLATALAAACLLGAVSLGWHMMLDGNVVETQFVPAGTEATMASLPMPGEIAGLGMDALNRALISAALPPQSVDLAHDTRYAAETMLERLPIGVELLAGP
jgi:hypothetical protein